MPGRFDPATVWAELRNDLKPGDEFATWSSTGRARAIPFQIETIGSSELIIGRNNDGKTYKIFRRSVEEMARIWDQYLDGRFPRSRMGEFTFASSYVLGIFAKLDGLTK